MHHIHDKLVSVKGEKGPVFLKIWGMSVYV